MTIRNGRDRSLPAKTTARAGSYMYMFNNHTCTIEMEGTRTCTCIHCTCTYTHCTSNNGTWGVVAIGHTPCTIIACVHTALPSVLKLIY